MVSALGFESGDPGSSPSRGRVLCLETCGKKNLMICKKIASMFSRYEVKSSHGEISISSVLHVCLPSGDYFKFAFYSKQKLPAALACRVTALDASLMLSATST